jgi:hypothetical protein
MDEEAVRRDHRWVIGTLTGAPGAATCKSAGSGLGP